MLQDVRVEICPGVRLWFDVEGVGLVPDGPRMVDRPTLLLLHGGPGSDHSMFKPTFSALTDLCQVVYYDHRANGRSDHGDPIDWRLDSWADDVVRLCDALEIERPIVLGLSFGGMVALRYAARHPDHMAGLVLASTPTRTDIALMRAAFARLGGPQAADSAQAFWSDPTPASLAAYVRDCRPLYQQQPAAHADTRVAGHVDLTLQFLAGEQRALDLLPEAAAIRCDVLVMAGGFDPVCPIELSHQLARRISPGRCHLETFDASGHNVFQDEPERALSVLRRFIASRQIAGPA
jgi:proline iminopeptidase